MKHCEYKRTVEGSKRAFLFVHGIVGTPDHFQNIIDMIPEDVTLWNILLDGHGKKVSDFSRSSMKKWEANVAAVVEELSLTHEEIYVVAHSMGALITIQEALTNPKIVKMFFVQPAMAPCLKSGIVICAFKMLFNKISPDDVVTLAATRCLGIELSKNLFKYIGWIPRFLELFAKMRKAVRQLNDLNTPCVAFVSKKDEVVAQVSGKILRRHSNITVFDMPKSGHFYYDPEDLALLRGEFSKFIFGEEKSLK